MSGNTKGFTIAELVVSITAGTIVALALFSITLFYYGQVLRAQAETSMLSESQIILRRVVEDLRTASTVLTSNTLADANEPAEGWTTSNENLILIISDPAVDRTTKKFITNPATGHPFQNEFIYFASDKDLYKRVLANPSASNNRATTTCPASLSSCTQPDPHLSDNFKSMNFVFFDQNGDETEQPVDARSIQINIALEKVVFGETVSVDNAIRITLRNPFLY